jgi:nucleoside 2-deoxyribosyltransferase
MAFYEKYMALKSLLENQGHTVIAPQLEFMDKGSVDTSNSAFFDAHGGISAFPPEHEFWKKKGDAISAHFRKIDTGDCILVTNYEKKGIPNYIGGNTFLEMGYAFGRGKKIFILNDIPDTSAYKEEMLGMQPVMLHGDIAQIA